MEKIVHQYSEASIAAICMNQQSFLKLLLHRIFGFGMLFVGDVIPGYPRGGPKCTRPDRVGRADGMPADSIRTVRRTKTTGSFQRCRDRPDLPCTSRDIVVT